MILSVPPSLIEQVLGLDVAVAMQPLLHRVLHPQAELDGEPQDLPEVEPRRADPAPEVAAGDQLQDGVRLPLDLLDGVGPDDVGVAVQLDPGAALGGEAGDRLAVAEELVAQGLDRQDPLAGGPLVVVDDVDEPHPAGVDVEDLVTVGDPVPHAPSLPA